MTQGQSPYKVVFYRTASGRSSVEEFLRSLPTHDRAKCERLLRRLERQGPALRPPKSKKMEGMEDIYELRVPGSRAYRLFYTPLGQRTYVVLDVILKQSRKTPREVVDRLPRLRSDAEQRRAEYEKS